VAASIKPGRRALRAVYRLLELIQARCAIYRQLTNGQNGALVMALNACLPDIKAAEKSRADQNPKDKTQNTNETTGIEFGY
jgi:hypothetical protein